MSAPLHRDELPSTKTNFAKTDFGSVGFDEIKNSGGNVDSKAVETCVRIPYEKKFNILDIEKVSQKMTSAVPSERVEYDSSDVQTSDSSTTSSTNSLDD